MKNEKLRDLTVEELELKLKDLKEELFNFTNLKNENNDIHLSFFQE